MAEDKGQKGKSDTALREEETLKFWSENKVFEQSLTKPARHGEFVFYDGPPFATGLPHSGSLLSSVSKDVIPRYKTMRGFSVRRRWGWDTHGLPIENLVEKKLGLKNKKEILALGIEKFNAEARSLVMEYVGEWKRYVERVGRWVDFDNSYKTMDATYTESVWWALKEIHKKGNLYEGRKVLMYCPHCETVLAKAEIAMDNTYKDITEESVFVKFRVLSPESIGIRTPAFMVAWTTTPWTLPGNVALAVGPAIEYVYVEQNNETLIVAKERAEALGLSASGKVVKGSTLVGLQYEPLYEIAKVKAHVGKKWQVLSADFVTTTDGTGIVHTAVIYGEDDYALGQKEGLPMVPILNPNATYNDDAPDFVRGEYIKKAEVKIKDDLESRGVLFKREVHTHSYPHCYRCNTPLIYNAVSSWFINIQSVKEKLLLENEKIAWFPHHLKHGRFGHIVESAPDWTISRNRFWASPLPIWKDADGNVTVIGSFAELQSFMKPGADMPRNRQGEVDVHLPFIDEVELFKDGKPLKRIPEVVDCWVESGAMPFAEYHYPFENKELFESRTPGDFVSEYIAQTRAWFYYMHAISVHLFGHLAFKHVTTTGNVNAADGQKVSKSKKNYTDPYLLFDQYGADAFRYYLMSSVVMQAEDMQFRDDDVKEIHGRVINILRNTKSFYALFKDDAPLASNMSNNVLDRWVLTRLDEVVGEATQGFDRYDTVRATRPMRVFIDDFSTWYVRRSRDRIKSDDSADKERALATMRYVLREFSKVIAPVMPFIAEEIYREVRTEDEPVSVHLTDWPKVPEGLVENMKKALGFSGTEGQLIDDMAEVRAVVTDALEARQKAGIKVRQPLGELKVNSVGLLGKADLIQLIADEINVKKVTVTQAMEDRVWLDTVLTEELIHEGELRDLVREVQDLRKSAGLNPKDLAILMVPPERAEAVAEHWGALAKAASLKSQEVSHEFGVRKS